MFNFHSDKWICFGLGLLITGLLNNPTAAEPLAKAVKATGQGAFAPQAPLAFIHPSNVPGAEPGVFDFGVVNRLNDEQDEKDDVLKLKWEVVYPGLKHDFVLKNSGRQAITLSASKPNSLCMDVHPVLKGRGSSFPYTVPPGQEVTIRGALDLSITRPGKVKASSKLYGYVGPKKPRVFSHLATFTMQADANGGLQLSTKQLEFGDVPFKSTAVQNFELKLAKQLPRHVALTASHFQLVSTNPHVSVRILSVNPKIEGLNIGKDTFGFAPRQWEDPAQDITLSCQATLSSNAPIGPVGGEVKVILQGYPMYAIVQGVGMRLKGKVRN
jgi:hypothetical protein